MKITKKKLMEKVNQEMKHVLIEKYLRNEIIQVLMQEEVSMSTDKIEALLTDVIGALENIDMSIDYLTSAVTGHDPYALAIAQRVAGRGGGRFQPRTTDEKTPMGEMQEIEEGYGLTSLNPRGFREPQEHDDLDPEGEYPEMEWPEAATEDPEALSATDKLGGKWQGPIDDEPAPQRPPKEYRRQAIELLASFNVKVDAASIDAVAWQLYNNEMQGDTVTMEEPPKKKRFKFFDEMIREELAMYLAEKKTKVSKAGKKRVSQKIDAMTQAGECDDNPKQCQAIAYSYEERGKLPK